MNVINGYINPFSDRYFETIKQFAWLNTSQKIHTVFLTIATFLITLPLLGIGGYVTFRTLVGVFTPIKRGEKSHIDKVDTVAEDRFQSKQRKKSGEEELFPSITEVENSNQDTISKVKANRTIQRGEGGIPNLGNTCYMNSALQLIVNTGLSHKIDQHIEEPTWDQFSLMFLDNDQLSDYIEQFKSNPDQIVDTELRNSLSQYITALEHYDKVLAHHVQIQIFKGVYLGRINDFSLQEAARNLRDVFVSPSTRIVSLPNSFSQQDAAEFMSAALPGIGYQIKLRKSITSADEMDQSEIDEDSHYLSIPIIHEQGEQKPSLQHLIDNFHSEYVIDPERKWNIVNEQGYLIRQHEQYWNRYTIVEEIPELIVIQLKRFRNDLSGKRVDKDDTSVGIDEVVDLSSLIDPSLLNEGDSVKYRISGIINHVGSLKGGHYTATVNVDDHWERRSDTQVSVRSSEEVRSDRENGYMYVLERVYSPVS